MARVHFFVVAICLGVCCCLYGGEAAQCVPDEVNPCIFRCNGTSFDLAKAFSFPINITEPSHRSDGRLYWYVWSPCEAYSCPGYMAKTDCALCQKADAHWCCGQTANAILKWDTFSRVPGMCQPDDGPRPSFPGYTIEYTFGTTWRIAVFQFKIDDTVEEPTIEFISEDPYLQYNFLVTGKCIGQDSYDCSKFYLEKQIELEEIEKQFQA